ncbi:hypothetical protein AWJ20_5304 [Sugiyamaella lignohabitans]|uniref:Pyridoxal phosphate homeostasis protein n=1 Tax=Sugiyamaella lignohabitans TaxID=796027 RepID=A0A167EQ81_9ASCO|nr:uncharacterized protein AWJ20_5304 [Sugiyamaella lignohabitans]ANB14335.1 hypothetical protein AWJ20_5304 [Sugiyamaella lignohabitans]
MLRTGLWSCGVRFTCGNYRVRIASWRTMASVTRSEELVSNYKAVVARIEQEAAKHGVPVPRLVAVSKYKPAEDIQVLYDAGHRHFGENYVQELTDKVEALPKDIQWHFIGSLQTNKCKVLGPIANLNAIETLDSVSKANKLNNARSSLESANPINVFLQINTSGEEQKSGLLDPQEIIALAQHIIKECPHLKLQGLMTIGSLASSTSGEPNQDFQKLVDIRTQVQSAIGTSSPLELSMGMSNDFVEAISQGSTNVRVGSSIFGSRKTKDEIKQSS